MTALAQLAIGFGVVWGVALLMACLHLERRIVELERKLDIR